MGNSQNFDKDKRNVAMPKQVIAPKIQEKSITLDVNFAPPTIKSSLKSKKKRMEKSKRIDNFENCNNYWSNVSDAILPNLTQTGSLRIGEGVSHNEQNGSTVFSNIRKKTLLERAGLSQDGQLSEEIVSSKKECVSEERFFDKVQISQECESKMDQSRMFPYGARKGGRENDATVCGEEVCGKNADTKSEVNEICNSDDGNKIETIDNDPVTTDNGAEKRSDVIKLRNGVSVDKLRTDTIRPISLPINADHENKVGVLMSKKLERADINVRNILNERRNINSKSDGSKYSSGVSRRCSKDSLICILKNQRSMTINRALQSLKVTPLDSKLYLSDSLEVGINKKWEVYESGKMVELMSKPGMLINLVGCHGSGKSEIVSVMGLQLIKNKKIACISIDCHGCTDDRSIMRRLLRSFNLNFSPLPDELFSDDHRSQINYIRLMNWICNYINFHGQIQLIILMFDGLDVDLRVGRCCVEKFFIPLLDKCISCLSILLCSSANFLNVPEESLPLNNQLITVSCKRPVVDSLNCDGTEGSFHNNQNILNFNGHVNHINLFVFKLQSHHHITPTIMSSFVSDNSSMDIENIDFLVRGASKLGVNLSAGKILMRGSFIKPSSLHFFLQNAEACSHPSLILLENEFVTKCGQTGSTDMKAFDKDENDKNFKMEKMNASIILAALEILDDDEHSMATILWLMSDFRTGFDLGSIICAMSTSKLLEDDLNWKVSLSEKMEINSCEDSGEDKQKILFAVTRLVQLGLLQSVKLPVTFSSPLSSRQASLNDPVAKPSRLQNQDKHIMTSGTSEVSLERSTSKYRIPNFVLPIARHLRPDFLGRPSLVLEYLMAKKLIAMYKMFYSCQSFDNVLDELDPIYPDFVKCLERSFTEQDAGMLKYPVELRVNQPMIHACQCLVSLPGAFFLSQILPLSTYMKIFFGISNMMKRKTFTKDNSKDCSIEYRALLCIILRHKMIVSKENEISLDKSVTTSNGFMSKANSSFIENESPKNIASSTKMFDNRAECPSNLFNFAEGISGCSKLNKASISDLITRIKFLLFQVSKSDRAYFYYIMGLHMWISDQDQAMMLMKKSIDLFKDSSHDNGDEILSSFSQVCIQVVGETYSWMLLSTDRVQAARHMYNFSDSLFSSASSSPLSMSAFSQNSFPTTSSSSSYYSLHSQRGSSPTSATSRNEEDVLGSVDKRDVYVNCKNLPTAKEEKKVDAQIQPSCAVNGGKTFHTSLENSESLTILAHCRNTLKSMNGLNSYYFQNASITNNKTILDDLPLKLRGLECRKRIWSELGLLARARDTSQACVELSKRWWGQNHPCTSEALMGRCLVAERLGRNHEAIDSCVQALLIRLKIFGDKHYESIEACTTLSRLLLKCSMYDECLELARRAVNMSSFVVPSRESQLIEAEKIIAAAEKKLNYGKQKRDSTTANIMKSVTFPDDLFNEANEKEKNVVREDDIVNKGKKNVNDWTTCSSAICKFDPELAQTFHRCLPVPAIA